MQGRVEECSGCVALPAFLIGRCLMLRGEALYRLLLVLLLLLFEVCIVTVCTMYTVQK